MNLLENGTLAPEIGIQDSRFSGRSEAVKRMVQDHQDVNTVLREANEKADKYIQDEKTR